jgi:CheY-like chemotaxis protein
MARPTTIFLAEDDDDLRALLSLALRRDGYFVVEARDGGELLDLLADVCNAPWSKPDVIITDVLMPCYSGLGILGALRNTHWDVPVIVITARRDADVARDAMRLGATKVIRKPIDLADLRTAILSKS